jgi:hypothetical protein
MIVIVGEERPLPVRTASSDCNNYLLHQCIRAGVPDMLSSSKAGTRYCWSVKQSTRVLEKCSRYTKWGSHACSLIFEQHMLAFWFLLACPYVTITIWPVNQPLQEI